MIVTGITDNHLRQRLLREPNLTLDSALKLGHAYKETKKQALELWRDFTQNPEIDQVYKFRKSYRPREQNPNLEVIVKCKFCSGTHNKGSCPPYGKIWNNCRNKGHFAKCCTKKKGIHSLNQECSDNAAQDDSRNDCENCFIGTINVQNSNPGDSGDINLKSTSAVVVSLTLRSEILNILHQEHIWIEQTKLCARNTVYWPGISKDITELISNCETCISFWNAQPIEPLLKHEIPDQPWVKIGADLFSFDNKDYVIVVDYTSKFFEISRLPNTEASTVINHTKAIFSRYGIPREVISDNGP